MKKVIIDITLANEEGLGMLKDYLDDNNLSYEVKSVEEGDASSVVPAFKAGDIVTIIGNGPTLTTREHFLEVGDVCMVVKPYHPITGGVEVSPLDSPGFTQRVRPDDIEYQK